MLEFIVEIKRALTLDSPKKREKELAYDIHTFCKFLQKCHKMAQKWPKITQNDPKWPKYDPKWPKMALE